MAYLEARDWLAAEGCLLWLRERMGPADLRVADALAYALLMQGAYGACERVLAVVLNHPDRSFWIAHKYGDALRGQQDRPGAIRAYRQALEDGSTSFLTARNLLEVLDGEGPDQALRELEAWPLPLKPWLLEGAQAAAALVAGPHLMEWLERQGLATPLLQRRLMSQRLYALQLPELAGVVPMEGGASPDDPDLAWCSALRDRLAGLGLALASIQGPRQPDRARASTPAGLA